MKYLRALPILFLSLLLACRTPMVSTGGQQKFYAVQSTTAADSISPIEQFLKPFRDSLSMQMNVAVAKAQGNFIKEKPAGSLGNLVTEAMLWSARQANPACEMSVCNYGGIRIPQISAGDITVGKVFELLPFENTLVIVEVPGKVLQQWIQLMASSEGWPVNGVNIDVDGATISLQSLPAETSPAKPIDETKTYLIVTNDYVANGGDKCSFLKDLPRKDLKVLVRDACTQYLREQKALAPQQSKHFTIHP